MNPSRTLVTGAICGARVEEIEKTLSCRAFVISTN